MTENCSAECRAQHTRRTSSIAHVSNTCNATVALDMHTVTDTWVHSSVGGLTEHTHTYRWSRSAMHRTTRKTTTWNGHHRKPCSSGICAKDDSPRRVFTCLPLDGSICLSPQETEFNEQFARQCRYKPPPEFSLTGKVQHHSSPYTDALAEDSQDHGGLQDWSWHISLYAPAAFPRRGGRFTGSLSSFRSWSMTTVLGT